MVTASLPEPAPMPPRSPRRHGLAIGIATTGIVVIVALAAAVVVLATRGGDGRAAPPGAALASPTTPTTPTTTDPDTASAPATSLVDPSPEPAPTPLATEPPTLPPTTVPVTDAPPLHGNLGVTTKVPDGGQSGAQVIQIDAGGPADLGGFQIGDVIVGVDGETIATYEQLIGAMRARLPGDRAWITVLRGVEAFNLEVVLTGSSR